MHELDKHMHVFANKILHASHAKHASLTWHASPAMELRCSCVILQRCLSPTAFVGASSAASGRLWPELVVLPDCTHVCVRVVVTR